MTDWSRAKRSALELVAETARRWLDAPCACYPRHVNFGACPLNVAQRDLVAAIEGAERSRAG